MAGKFELYKDKAGEFRFRLKAGNGQTILASGGYKARSGAENGIASVQKNSSQEARFEKRETSNGKPYFVLKAGNSEIIGQSEHYESEAARDNGIKSVMTNGSSTVVDDLTAA